MNLLQDLIKINNCLGQIYTNGYSTIRMNDCRRLLNMLALSALNISEKGENEMINQAQLEQLARIYNTLLLVNTKGEDTITMGDCLRALKQSIEDLQRALESASQPMEEMGVEEK